MEKLDIYDFQPSSPGSRAQPGTASKEALAEEDVRPASRSTRRHSALPSSGRSQTRPTKDQTKSTESSMAPAPSRFTARRKDVRTVGGHYPVSSTAEDILLVTEASAQVSQHDGMKPSKSVADFGASVSNDKEGRAERAAARRRSMML